MLAGLVCAASITARPASAQVDGISVRQAYDAKIRQTYIFRFGDEISAPGNAAIGGNKFIQPGAFPDAAYCANCHPEAYRQWRQALHSNSFRTPFYRTSVNILARTKGIDYTRHCDSCHNPIGVLSGALNQNSTVDRSFDEDGLTCMTCHSIQKLQANSGNGSYMMGVPAVMVDEKGQPIPGKVPDAEIMAHPERHAKAVMKDFYHTAEFCGACHKANLPNPLNDYKFIRAFTVYDEWQNSKFSKQNPLTFYSADYRPCQKCHMMRVPASAGEYGAKKGTFASHRWLAGNTAVPFYYGYKEQLQQTIEFLRSGMYLNVDFFAIKNMADGGMTAPLGSEPFRLARDEMVQMFVVIQNKNIGHSLVPEVRDLYEPWVELEVKDADKKEIYHSGFLKPDGSLDERAHSFTNRPVDSRGEFVDNHKVWTIHSVAYDNTIQAGRSVLIRYQFRIPPAAKGPLTVTARVNYRHLRQSYLNNVFGKDHPAYPVVTLASRTRVLNIGENPPSGHDAQDNPDWMRWNNLGIAYLDQLQYSDAINAFDKVVKLRPDYADGLINLGVTYIGWEKYSAARPSLEKALSLSPSNARALYYLALVERREGNCDREIADLQKVVEQYPKSRDAHRELGISYYQQHRYADARQQFEALQTIDPDDLAAHYNLAVLYRRMGLKKQASEQSALFATKQVDPGAPTYSLDYLRRHPEISIESDPFHVHQEMRAGAPQQADAQQAHGVSLRSSN
jgi:Flp pilus assembly protein TadD